MFNKRNKTRNLPTLKPSPVIKRPKSKLNFQLGQPDWQILIVTAFLTLFGIIMVFSASAFLSLQNKDFNFDPFYIFNRHLIWIAISLLSAIVLYKLPIITLKRLSIFAIVLIIRIMIYMLPEALSPIIDSQTCRKAIEMPLVSTKNCGTRWIDIGFSDIQPSELIKIPLIVFTSFWFSMGEKNKKKVAEFVNKYKSKETLHSILSVSVAFLPFILLGAIVFFVLVQRDLDSAVVIAMPVIIIYFAATKTKNQIYTLISIIIIGIVAGFLLITNQDYRKGRYDSYTEILVNGEPSLQSQSSTGFQSWHGLIAIGSGGIFGKGYNESREKFYYLQEAAYTDSIFAVTAEEFGLVGSMTIVLSFLYLGSRGLKNSIETESSFKSYVQIGVTSWIVVQAFLNIAANLAIIPFAGMPLPFFSYGGSNTLMIILGVSLLLSFSRKNITTRSNPLLRKRSPIY